MSFRQLLVKKEAKKLNGQGRRRELEVGDRRLYTIQAVREQLDMMSRGPFKDFLAMLLGAHPTEESLLAFAQNNPEKWANTVRTFATLTGYREEIEVNLNVMAKVKIMSDMDLEHQLRDLQSKIGDSYLVDPAVIETPFKRVDSSNTAIRRISKQSK